MFGFLKALLFTNIWMLTLPLEVLAGTCESDKSVMKMPLLFAVAMIGAAVGGKIILSDPLFLVIYTCIVLEGDFLLLL